MIENEEFQDLQRRCKARGWDAERLIAFANALHLMTVKSRYDRYGNRQATISCYKSKKAHHKIPANYRENF